MLFFLNLKLTAKSEGSLIDPPEARPTTPVPMEESDEKTDSDLECDAEVAAILHKATEQEIVSPLGMMISQLSMTFCF